VIFEVGAPPWSEGASLAVEVPSLPDGRGRV